MSEKEILGLHSESSQIEFKRVGAEKKYSTKIVNKVLETIVAMANTDGGYIILGVNDPKRNELKGVDRIFGIEENKENYDGIIQGVSNISPELNIQFHDIRASNGKTIVILQVEKAEEHGHTINKKSFMRLKTGNRRLTPNEYARLIYTRGFKSADEETEDIDISILETDSYEDFVLNCNTS